MTNDLKFVVSGTELAKHLMTKREEHVKLSGAFEKRAAELTAMKMDNDDFVPLGMRGSRIKVSDARSVRGAERFAEVHRQRANFLQFMATHLQANVDYHLSHDELFALEFVETFDDIAFVHVGTGVAVSHI